MHESTEAKIARIDTNVKSLLNALPKIQILETESAVNKRDHRVAIFIIAAAIGLGLAWVKKQLGV